MWGGWRKISNSQYLKLNKDEAKASEFTYMHMHLRVVATREYHAVRVALSINSLSYATAL